MSVDPKSSMRPYRRVDMGSELDEHGKRIGKLERLEGQLRVLQTLALALGASLMVMGWRSCISSDDIKIEHVGMKQRIEVLEKQPPDTNNEDTFDSMQMIDKEHGDRLRMIEKKLYIRRKK